MELKQLRYVIAVAQYRSFTKAAGALTISLSTLSEQIRRIEEDLGVSLFNRTTRHVQLTIAGHIFLSHAMKISADLTSLREAVRQREAAPRGIITLGIPLGASPPQFWRTLATFEKEYTGISIRLVETIVPSLIKHLHSGLLDLSMISWPASDVPTNLAFQEIARHRTTVVVSKDSRLAKRRKIALCELERALLVTYVEGFSLRQIAIDVCRRAGFTPAIAFESSSNEAILEFVGRDVGFSILPIGKTSTTIVYLECEPAPMDRMLGIAWPIDRQFTPTAALLRDRIAEACSGISVW